MPISSGNLPRLGRFQVPAYCWQQKSYKGIPQRTGNMERVAWKGREKGLWWKCTTGLIYHVHLVTSDLQFVLVFISASELLRRTATDFYVFSNLTSAAPNKMLAQVGFTSALVTSSLDLVVNPFWILSNTRSREREESFYLVDLGKTKHLISRAIACLRKHALTFTNSRQHPEAFG